MIARRSAAQRVKLGRDLRRLLLQVTVTLAAVAFIYPLVFMISGAFKPVSELTHLPPTILPQEVVLTGFQRLLTETSFPRWFLNSVLVALIRVSLTLIVAGMAAFAMASYDFRFKKVIFAGVVASVLLPFEALYMPLLSVMIDLGWLNTYLAVTVPFVASGFAVFVLYQYLQALPPGLLDAARVDGASEWRVFWNVAVPVSRPAFGAVAIILFLQSWNSFLWPLVAMQRTESFLLPVGLTSLLTTAFFSPEVWTAVLAASTLMTIPIIVVFVLMQRRFVEALTGSIHG
jgi:ABC-type glycerol-3-phosphate transport system permease component